MSIWFLHHTKLGRQWVGHKHDHAFQFRESWRKEVDAIKRVREFIKLEEGEEKRKWMEEHPSEPRPAFRRLILDDTRHRRDA